ncbi:hypothetical protein Q4Q35_00415 [Flavivirga aquimarina]|uniref:Iron transporter n=1 Tax=Flavivirga aquimarina TaxID=2027862 RepID=A0ABT8W582_9FLAO|nr:hypothetical protein [Flavivirga aquimarina]MDO5968257.1 hypothetical protein [Flavivirga aquimarina]
MPANKKYLIQSSWIKASKFLAAFLGSLFATMMAHIALSYIFDQRIVLVTALYSTLIIWPLLILVVYWIKKAWISWIIFLFIIILSTIVIYILKP